MSKLFLMAGTKGGIGKTLVATLLADFPLTPDIGAFCLTVMKKTNLCFMP